MVNRQEQPSGNPGYSVPASGGVARDVPRKDPTGWSPSEWRRNPRGFGGLRPTGR
jgi:hypothetical protein